MNILLFIRDVFIYNIKTMNLTIIIVYIISNLISIINSIKVFFLKLEAIIKSLNILLYIYYYLPPNNIQILGITLD